MPSAEYRRGWRQRNLERNRIHQARYNASHREQRKEARLIKRYGITAEQVKALSLLQEDSCAICREPFKKTPHVDHDHSTGKVRGLLCYQCNMAIGHLKDSPQRCESAGAYLLSGGFRVSSE